MKFIVPNSKKRFVSLFYIVSILVLFTISGASADFVSDRVKSIVATTTRETMSEREKALALHDWLVLNTHYDLTYSRYSAEELLKYGSGVCNAYAETYQKLATEAGLECKKMTGTAGNGGHAWNLVRVDGQWYHVDTTWDDPVLDVAKVEVDNAPARSGNEHHEYFLMTDKQIRKNHSWTGCISADQNYVEFVSAKNGNYYYGADGKRATGWTVIRNNSYYFDQNGNMQTGLQYLDGSLYFFQSDGSLQKGWVAANGKQYFASRETGALMNGWINDQGQWYYAGENYELIYGDWLQDGGKWYFFGNNGEMYRNDRYFIEGNFYYFDNSGAWIEGKDIVFEWKQTNGKWRYIDTRCNSMLISGPWEIKGSWYIFDNQGYMKTGWCQSFDNWYYASSSGELVKGWHVIDGVTYYFGDNHCMYTGERTVDGVVYHFDSNGALLAQ